jgi:hypothetical protein
MTACERGARISADELPPHGTRQIKCSDEDSGAQTDPIEKVKLIEK